MKTSVFYASRNPPIQTTPSACKSIVKSSTTNTDYTSTPQKSSVGKTYLQALFLGGYPINSQPPIKVSREHWKKREKPTVTTAEITINNRTRIASGANPITADWCLFEAVQRLPFESTTPLVVDILEGLSVHKYNQRLSYRGLYTRANNSLQWFHQIGHGVLPYEYWLDNHHRLQMVTTGARTYILSDDAEGRLTHQKTRGTRAFKRRQKKYAGGDRDA